LTNSRDVGYQFSNIKENKRKWTYLLEKY